MVVWAGGFCRNGLERGISAREDRCDDEGTEGKDGNVWEHLEVLASSMVSGSWLAENTKASHRLLYSQA